MATVTPLSLELRHRKEPPVVKPSLRWHRILLETVRQPWSSIVVVPASSGTSGMSAARALISVARLYRANPVVLLDAAGVDDAASVNALASSMYSAVEQGRTVIVTVDPLVDNQAGIPIVMKAEAALLCVTLGETDLKSAQETLDLIRDKTLGIITIYPDRQ